MKSKAAILVKSNEVLSIRDVESPPVDDGCVLVRTLVTGVCGTDVHCWRGQVPLPLPVILGHESIGIIETLGNGRNRDSIGEEVAEGDKVFWVAGQPCGQCYYCLVLKDTTSCPHRRSYGTSWSCNDYPYLTGGYSENVFLTPRSHFFKLPNSVSPDSAIAFGCGFPTAVKGFESIKIRPNEKVVIQGSGPVGLSSLILAKMAGAGETIVIGDPPERLDLAKRLGASHVIGVKDTTAQERARRIRELIGEVDVCVEASGFPSTIPEGIEILRPNGRYLIMGVFSDIGGVEINPSPIVRKNIQLHGSVYWEPRHLHAALSILKSRNDILKLERAVTERYSLDDASKGLMDVENLRCVKAVIQP